nr:PREDICTED: membrane cofactor protein isoform X2 [Anolis carolinensis]|eukprot:XP_016850973.1 PREDICTED: membrane cofactor protein isoform X2 [Anolis carolinensis]
MKVLEPGEGRKEGRQKGKEAQRVTSFGRAGTTRRQKKTQKECLPARASNRKSRRGGAFPAVCFAVPPGWLRLSRCRTEEEEEEEEEKGVVVWYPGEAMEGPAWSLSPLLLPLLLLSGAHGDCGAPPVQLRATLQAEEPRDSYPVGTILRYKCIPGYQYITINPTIKCLDNSEWSTAPTFCEEKSCKAPTVENGGIRGDLQFGATITYFCDPGYKPQGATTARCILFNDNVRWDTDPPLCDRIQCVRPPIINNGRHNGNIYEDVYTVGTVVTYTCDKNVSLIGNASITCVVAKDNENGMWDYPAPECKVVECSRPQIENGRLTSPFQPTYMYNHQLQFVCNPGYTLKGSEFVTCNAKSEWDPRLPECNIVQPEKPTIRPGPSPTTTETITKETESTQRPDPEDKPGSNTVMGIVLGKVTPLLVLQNLTMQYHVKRWKWKKHEAIRPECACTGFLP